MKIKNDGGMQCVLVDPYGHIRWLSNNSLAGRQFFGPVKNDLVICHFIGGTSLSVRIRTGFNSDIDYIGAVNGSSINLVTVYSIKENKYCTIDISERVVVETGSHKFFSNFQIPSVMETSLLSPDKKKVVIRRPEEGKRPATLVVYDVIE